MIVVGDGAVIYVDTIVSDSKERNNINGARVTLRQLQNMKFTFMSWAKLNKILALYALLLTIGLRNGTRYWFVDVVPPPFQETGLRPRHGSRDGSRVNGANVYSWTMPTAMKRALGQDLERLRWQHKDSIVTTKAFIEKAKRVVSRRLAGTELLNVVLHDLASATGSVDAVVVSNLPLDPLVPPTPTDGRVSLGTPTNVADALLLALGELTGSAQTVGYSAEKAYSNPWVHEGFPRQGAGSALTATEEVALHQDMSYQHTIPDLLGLICLREGQDTEVRTTLVSTDEILEQLSDKSVDVLRQRRFQIQASQWVDKEMVDLSTLRPILDGKSLHLPVNWDNMVGADEVAKNAVEQLKEVLRAATPSVGVHLKEGMMVLFNNQKVVHGRTPYAQLKFDGTDRVLYRSYFANHLEGLEEMTRIV